MKTNHNKQPKSPRALSKHRIRIAEIGSIICCLLFMSFVTGKYLILPVTDASYSATKNMITYDTIKSYMVEGDILDRSGNIVMGNASAGISASASYPQNESYAYLLGYYSVNDSQENMYGLRGSLKDYSLFTLDANNKGATTTLTTDTGLQNYAYQLLNGQEGSITVINNNTGAILALASHSTITYDVNNLSAFLSSTAEGAQFRRGTYENDPPGSTFKVITAAAALTKAEEENLPDSFFEYDDYGYYVPDGSQFTITNFGNRAYGHISLETALNYSVNSYFADLGVRTGETYLSQMTSAFMIGKDIEIPFLTTLRSSIDIGDGSAEYLSQISFGQGNTEITPVHLALIAQAIANDGVMMQPYIVDHISSGNLPLYRYTPSRLNTCLKESINDQLKQIMHSTAEMYGLYESVYGMVYAKTGTAECANDRIHTYMIGFTDQYSFCISINNTSQPSSALYPVAQNLVSYLNQYMN